MESGTDVLLPALNFVSGNSDHICRLCFASTENEEISLEDNVRLERPYYDETISFISMFEELGVNDEHSLPQVLCINCATMTISSYLFRKLCQHSSNQWNYVCTKFNGSLDQAETAGPNTQTVYLLINNNENLVFTSKKCHTNRSKKTALLKIKEVSKSRQAYVKTKHKSKVICEECGERFPSKCHLLKHMIVHSKSKYPCSQCHKIFASQIKLNEHAERVHYPKKIKCPKCSKKFGTVKMLKYHDNFHHVAAVCKLCFVQFPSKKELRGHLDKHDVNKCPRCNKSFLNKYTFKLHLKICGEAKKPEFFCDICNKGYARKNGLRTHMKIDHGFGNVLSCKWCEKKFDAISRLKNHMVKHTRERNYNCEYCGGKFVTPAALVYHTRLHTGEKPFSCDECGESFLSASRRMAHKMRKHIGPTRECPICHSKFVTGHQLRKHIQRHYNSQSKLYVPEEVPLHEIHVNTQVIEDLLEL